jgi:16S rRNA processing protein RimM
MPLSREWLRAGRVGRPHGLDGSFHVTQPNPRLLEEGMAVRVGDRRLRIDRRAGTDRQVILRLEGFSDRPAAESVRGQELLAPRDSAPALEADEWWAEDLEGCAVHDAGRPVGTVRRLLALPSCDVLEVEREAGTLLVPLIADAVRDVDAAGRRIDVDLRFLGEPEPE